MWHKHKWEVVGFSITSQGLIAPRGWCFDVLKCSKCGKLKTGDIREFTRDERLSLADNYRKQIQGESK